MNRTKFLYGYHRNNVATMFEGTTVKATQGGLATHSCLKKFLENSIPGRKKGGLLTNREKAARPRMGKPILTCLGFHPIPFEVGETSLGQSDLNAHGIKRQAANHTVNEKHAFSVSKTLSQFSSDREIVQDNGFHAGVEAR